ncbi:MAG: NUDIX hydrolase [Nitrospira sp.]|nr:NUDIX hydrolase [Nitrospira sp.]MCA9475359.1 NUDIX hydrolase [Nitrospira sp.]MCA9481830.1 NUDIX hydrolase [Nitrospira sp.]MCB9711792.1 NUDIX hydrolase [Nitrospiraceae bacterium]
MKHCPQCGTGVENKIPSGDTLHRAVCPACQTIHYENPKIVAGCIPEWENKILLCRRAIEPRLGLWTIPAGFMELGESTEEAAVRETLEEANADVRIHTLFGLFSLPHVSQVYVVYRAHLLNLNYKPGPESLEVQLVSLTDIPWAQLAFPVIHESLSRYVQDVQTARSNTHSAVVPPQKHRSSPSSS